MNKSYVIAGNMDEFRRFVNRKKAEYVNTMAISPIYIYVHSVDTLRGLCEVHGWYTGTYEQRSDIEEIKTMIRVINSCSIVTHTPTGSKISGYSITGVWLDEIAEWKSTAPIWNPPETVYINSSI